MYIQSIIHVCMVMKYRTSIHIYNITCIHPEPQRDILFIIGLQTSIYYSYIYLYMLYIIYKYIHFAALDISRPLLAVLLLRLFVTEQYNNIIRVYVILIFPGMS
jgi:hypothetical protein